MRTCYFSLTKRALEVLLISYLVCHFYKTMWLSGKVRNMCGLFMVVGSILYVGKFVH